MYLSLDPGRQKFGWAFLEKDGELLCSGISPTSDIKSFLLSVSESEIESLDDSIIEGKLKGISCDKIDKVFLGNGTGSGVFLIFAREFFPEVISVDERDSTLNARGIFWAMHPPTGWRRFLPLSLQTPPRPVDDLAAYCIALRGMRDEKEKEKERCLIKS